MTKKKPGLYLVADRPEETQKRSPGLISDKRGTYHCTQCGNEDRFEAEVYTVVSLTVKAKRDTHKKIIPNYYNVTYMKYPLTSDQDERVVSCFECGCKDIKFIPAGGDEDDPKRTEGRD
jgi:hypothetical protein